MGRFAIVVGPGGCCVEVEIDGRPVIGVGGYPTAWRRAQDAMTDFPTVAWERVAPEPGCFERALYRGQVDRARILPGAARAAGAVR